MAGGDQFFQLCCKLGQVLAREGQDPGRARGYLENALAHIPLETENVERVKCLAALAACLVQEQAVPQAVEQAQTALELAESTGQPDGVASACGALCKVHEVQGDVPAYMEAAQRQIVALDESDDLYSLYEAYYNITGVNYFRGRYSEAEQWVLAGLRTSEKFNAPGWESVLLAFYTSILSKQGRWPEALAHGERVLPLFQRVGCSSCFSYIFAWLAEVEGRRGNREQAWKHIDDAIDIFLQIDSPTSPASIIRWRFLGHVYLQEWEDAWAQVEESRARNYSQSGALPASLYVWTMYVPEVAARVGRWTEAASLAREALALFGSSELLPGVASSHFALGLVYAGQEQWDEALSEYEDALARFRALGHAWDTANTLYETGLVYSARQQAGDLDEARQCFGQALATFTELEAKPSIAKVRAALEQDS
jgi:tetratricopeptide (TPR) repeat protein